MLAVRNLTVSIAGKTVCRELNFAIAPGQCWGVLGQNGAGKSTLLRTLAGLHPAEAGEVVWHDAPISRLPRRELARELGVLGQQDSGEFWGTVEEFVRLGRFPHRRGLFGFSATDESAVTAALAAMELADLAQRPLNQLSGGERQRAAIAQTLAQQARYLLLDEPLQNLDLRHQAAAMQVFAERQRQGCGLLLVLHDLLWAQRGCDHLLLLYPDGRAEAGPAADLLTRERLEALYQCRLREALVEGGRCFLPGV